MENYFFAFSHAVFMQWLRKITPIMTNPHIFRIQIFPTPVKSRNLTIIGLFYRNIITLIISLVSPIFVS